MHRREGLVLVKLGSQHMRAEPPVGECVSRLHFWVFFWFFSLFFGSLLRKLCKISHLDDCLYDNYLIPFVLTRSSTCPNILSGTFTTHRTGMETVGYFSNSTLPLPPTSQTFRHWPGDYCRELISTHRLQPNSNQEPVVSEGKSLTSKLNALSYISFYIKLYFILIWRKFTFFI